jgi:hypothetical protein
MSKTATLERTNADENPYDILALPMLLIKQESIKEELQAVQKIAEQIDLAIRTRVADAVADARAEAGKFEGTIHAVVEGCEVISNVPKRVEWDTDKLNELARDLDGAEHWIDFKLSVSEKKYTSMPPAIRKIIDAARTLKHGKETLKITEVN